MTRAHLYFTAATCNKVETSTSHKLSQPTQSITQPPGSAAAPIKNASSWSMLGKNGSSSSNSLAQSKTVPGFESFKNQAKEKEEKVC